jgi:hypothetical protein
MATCFLGPGRVLCGPGLCPGRPAARTGPSPQLPPWGAKDRAGVPAPLSAFAGPPALAPRSARLVSRPAGAGAPGPKNRPGHACGPPRPVFLAFCKKTTLSAPRGWPKRGDPYPYPSAKKKIGPQAGGSCQGFIFLEAQGLRKNESGMPDFRP